MDHSGMGQFIAELRKKKHLTQRNLAERLHITDKAVSKWERGLSCPDIALLPELASILDVTVDELLSGRRNAVMAASQEMNIESVIDYAEQSLANKMKNIRKICAVGVSASFFIGAFVCVVCDLAISGKLTWSLIPLSSILFAWIVLFPLLRFGIKGIVGALLALSILVIPYLNALAKIIRNPPPVMPAISRRMAVIGLLFMWALYGLFRMLHPRKWLAAAWSCLLAVPVCIAVNYSLAGLLGTPVMDGWDALTVGLLLAGSAVLFFKGHR